MYYRFFMFQLEFLSSVPCPSFSSRIHGCHPATSSMSMTYSINGTIESKEQITLAEDGYAPNDFCYNCQKEVIVPERKQTASNEIYESNALEEPPYRNKAYIYIWNFKIVKSIP